MELDTPMRLASATKFLTTIMALQCVERGLFGLDEPVDKWLPDLAATKVLTGFESDPAGRPITRDRHGSITLRHLLTHTAGLAYVFLHPLLEEWVARGYLQSTERFSIESRLGPPAINEPGAEWRYGAGLDWVGRMIERATGMDLEEYLQRNVCEPLDIIDITFQLQQRPDLLARRADQTYRNEEDGSLRYDDSVYFRHDGDECFGGQGAFSSPRAYMKVLHSLLKRDGLLLRPETVDLMFQPSLDAPIEQQMNELMDASPSINYAGPVPLDLRKSFGLGGILAMDDLDGEAWRRKGSMTFGGSPHVLWVRSHSRGIHVDDTDVLKQQIDPAAGLCTLACFQLEPWNDPTCQVLMRAFERAMYAQLPTA